MKRSKKLREWLRAPRSKSALEGLGLTILQTAVCAPVLYALAYRHSFSNYGGFDERLVFIGLVVAGVGITFYMCGYWENVGKPFEVTLGKPEPKRFRLGHLMALAAESFVLGWLLHEGRLAPTEEFRDLCRSVPLMIAVQVFYVLVGLLVAAKIQRMAEKEHWPDLEALLAVALLAPVVLVPVIGFALLLLVHGAAVLVLVPVVGMVLLPLVWLFALVADESRRTADRVKKEHRNRARRAARARRLEVEAQMKAKAELPNTPGSGS